MTRRDVPYMFQYDAIFAEEYWNHPDNIIDGYVPPEYDSYYTPIPEGDNHVSWYYLIDYRLIEYVGIPEFEAWIAEVPDEEQNIVAFTEKFGITKEIYLDVYKEYIAYVFEHETIYKFLPYNPDYLFGTPEMQDKYFTVHPYTDFLE